MFRLLAGSYIFVETRLFRDIGGFDQSFYAAEEIDLTKRLKRAAARRGKRIVVLNAAPLASSGRKAALYGRAAHVKFFLLNAISLGRALKDKSRCNLWYDGKR